MYDRTITSREIMTNPVYTDHPTGRVKRAIALLCPARISSLPVVDGKSHLVGMISKRDRLEAAYPNRQELQQGRAERKEFAGVVSHGNAYRAIVQGGPVMEQGVSEGQQASRGRS